MVERLEDRTCPAITSWKGTVSTDWALPGNWSNGVPDSTTDAQLGSLAITNAPTIAAGTDAQVGTINTFSGFNSYSLTVNGHLTVNGTGNSAWSNGFLEMATSAYMRIMTKQFSWGGSSISDAAGMGGDIYVSDGGTLYITTSAQKLGVNNLRIGAYLNAQGSEVDSPGTVKIGGMTNNLTVVRTLFIENRAQGKLYLSQSDNADVSGCVLQDTNVTSSYVSNSGLLERNAGGTTLVLRFNIPVINAASTGQFMIDAGTSLNISNPTNDGYGFSLQQNDGLVQIGDSAIFNAAKQVTIDAGTFKVMSKAGGGNGSTTIGAALYLNAGTFIIGDQDRNYETLNVNGAVYIRGGNLQMNVNGSDGTTCDKIVATGTLQINGTMRSNATLTITTDNANPGSPAFDILQGNTLGTTDFASFSWLGQTTTGYTHTPNNPAGKYRLS